MDEKDNQITIGPGDAALVFRGKRSVIEIHLSAGIDSDAATATDVIATAIGIWINQHPKKVQSIIDEHLMFSGVTVVPSEEELVSSETLEEDDGVE